MKRALVVIFVIFLSIIAARFLFGGPEDDWICTKGEWVMHGKPVAPRPTTPCST